MIETIGDRDMSQVQVKVYGADVVCASCVNAPNSVETYEWVQALFNRKYPEIDFTFTYIDFEHVTGEITESDAQFIEQLKADELFYPLITINDAYVADGYIQTKALNRFIEEHILPQS